MKRIANKMLFEEFKIADGLLAGREKQVQDAFARAA